MKRTPKHQAVIDAYFAGRKVRNIHWSNAQYIRMSQYLNGRRKFPIGETGMSEEIYFSDMMHGWGEWVIVDEKVSWTEALKYMRAGGKAMYCGDVYRFSGHLIRESSKGTVWGVSLTDHLLDGEWSLL